MSRKRLAAITAGVMLSLFMSSMEATVVATAMPTIVSQLGGLEIYSWAFSIYLLTSTTSVPVFGKLSDILGRRPVYAVAMGLFLLGSLICGLAETMPILIAGRAVQGLGAGGLLTLAFTMVGDVFTFEQRARMQGLFSGVWGVSSVIGPLLGGFLVDQISWHWIFYFNIGPGLLAALVIWFAWIDLPRPATRPNIDYAGAALLTVGIMVLLLGLFAPGTTLSWALLSGAAVCLAALFWVERRAADPILPLALFRDRMFAVACAQGVLAGWTLFGSTAYVPLFVQAVLGTSATVAGATLTPMMLSWVVASIIGSRMLLRFSYRSLALAGMVALAVGSLLLSSVQASTPQALLLLYLALMGGGMGLSIPAFLIAVQSTVQRRSLGMATSTLQFSRSIGGTLGVSVMGAALSMQLAARLTAAGLEPGAVAVDSLLDPVAGSGVPVAIEGAVRTALAGSLQVVFVIACVAAVLGLLATMLAPRGDIAQLAAEREAENLGASV